MDGNKTVTANFARYTYALTTGSTAGGSVSIPGETGPYSYQCGDIVDLLAVPDEGYEFANWTGDVGTVANVNAANTTIIMNGNYSITANFSHIVYTLTVSSGTGGSVSKPGEGAFNYASGTVVDLLAAADTGYRFVSWTGDVGTITNANAANATITMNGNYTIQANFEAIPQYALNITSTEGGNVTEPGEGTFTYYEGTVVDLLAVADTGYRFVNWTGDVGTMANANAADTTITINGNYTIQANFEAIHNTR